MPVTAVVGAATVATGAIAADKQADAAEAQGAANRRAAESTQEADARRAAEVQALVEDIAFNPVDPLDFEGSGLRLTEVAQDFQQRTLDESRTRTLGSQAGAFESLKQRLSDEANLQFGPELSRVIDGSALSRSAGTGVIGAAERVATDQRFNFATASAGQLTNLLNFETQFNAAPLNPIDNIFRLAQFEFQNRTTATNLELQKAGILVNSANQTFATTQSVNESLAANDPSAIGLRADANQVAAIGQSISALGGTLSGINNQLATQDTANQALALQQLATNDQRSAAGLPPIDFTNANQSRGFLSPARPVSSFAQTPSAASIGSNRS